MVLSEILSGLFIPDPEFLPIPDPGVKKAPDLGSGSATLLCILCEGIERRPRFSPLKVQHRAPTQTQGRQTYCPPFSLLVFLCGRHTLCAGGV
jgi:hypothetical protein